MNFDPHDDVRVINPNTIIVSNIEAFAACAFASSIDDKDTESVIKTPVLLLNITGTLNEKRAVGTVYLAIPPEHILNLYEFIKNQMFPAIVHFARNLDENT